jgi:alkanesulfonate monooxygenase SsuD/methylene tetrahydromethanopterin reductase-like flavin-dependent oxidoreductase (luciferase family)
VARQAEQAGLDGVFVFDHMWPLGQPERPALHGPTLAAALAAATSRVVVGTLVARVGLIPDAVLVKSLATTASVAGPGRFIAGLGTGDRANREENLAYGVPFAPAAERLASLAWCLRALRDQGVTTWAGGLSPALVEVAAREADAWNGWGIGLDRFTALARGLPAGVEATWAGQVLVGRDRAEAEAKRERLGDRPGLVWGTPSDLADHLAALAAAGATWAVCAPLDVGADEAAPDLVAQALELSRGR